MYCNGIEKNGYFLLMVRHVIGWNGAVFQVVMRCYGVGVLCYAMLCAVLSQY